MCDMIDSQSAEKISRMKKLRRTLSESFSRIGEARGAARRPGGSAGLRAGVPGNSLLRVPLGKIGVSLLCARVSAQPVIELARNSLAK